jgi:hypothetical protein
MERQMGLNLHHPSFSGYLIQGFNQNGRDAIGQQLVAYPISQQQQQQLSFSTAAPLSRGLSSHNWRILCPDGNVFTRSPPVQTTAAAHVPSSMGQAERRGITAPTGPGVFNDGYAYYLNRGNGELTRLVPADMLPALNEIPPREPERRGMVVLPPLRGIPPKGMADMSQTITVKVSELLWNCKHLWPRERFHLKGRAQERKLRLPGVPCKWTSTSIGSRPGELQTTSILFQPPPFHYFLSHTSPLLKKLTSPSTRSTA